MFRRFTCVVDPDWFSLDPGPDPPLKVIPDPALDLKLCQATYF